MAALWVAAGGSRERLDVRQFYRPLYPRNRIDAMGKTSRWVIPGSRLLRHSLVGWALRQNSRGRLARAKAAPLQGLGTNASRQRATPFDPFENSLPAIVRSRIHHGCESVRRRRDDDWA
jgi:hypothetical protein